MKLNRAMSLLLIAMAAATTAPAAQAADGTWVTHSRFSYSALSTVVDAGSKVYYVASNSLYCFDKATKTQTTFTKGDGGLNSTLVTGVYYNPDKDYVVVTYDDSNLDIITPEGKVTNVPYIKDAVMYRYKTINDVSFTTGRIYVTTAYGYLVLDDTTFRALESRVPSYNVSSMAQVGQWMLASCSSTTSYVCYFKVSSPVEHLGAARQLLMPAGKITPVTDTTFLLLTSTHVARYTMTDNADGRTVTLKADTLLNLAASNLQRTPTGFIVNVPASSCYYTLDATATTATRVSGGKELWSAAPGGDGTLWGVGDKGLHSSADASTYHKPNAVSIVNVPFYMAYNATQGKLYLTNLADNLLLPDNKYAVAREMNAYDGEQWADVTPTTTGSVGWYNIVFDPNDPNTYWESGRYGTIYRVSTITGAVTSFDMNKMGGVGRRAALAFDKWGNLLLAQSSFATTTENSLFILTRDKLAQSSYAASDFIAFTVPHMKDANSFKGLQLAVAQGSDVRVFANGDWAQYLIFFKQDSTCATLGDVTYYKSLTSDNGKSVTWTYIYAMHANAAGQVAVGYNNGMFFCDPAEAFGTGFTVTAPSAVSGRQVNAIATDASGNWWVGTSNDGIYVLSADGATQLAHYSTSSGELADDNVYSLCADTVSNSMWVVSSTAVQQYVTSVSTAAADLSQVYAYPNPVHPDYTGMITISGLTEGAVVTIKDAAGTVVKTLQSAGGTAVWDGCYVKGDRVATGIYGIYAAQSGEAEPQQPTATLRIIR